MEFLSNIALAIMAPIIAFGGFIHDVVTPDPIIQVQYVPEYIEIPSGEELNTGATVPSAVALYVDSLASAITANDTSFTLVRGTDKTGTALASSTYGFIIDEGSANEEMVLANCTGTVCTGVIRGINPVSGTSTTDSLKKSHRRGAVVKMTDGPILITLSQILGGREGFGAIVKYDTSVATTSFTDRAQIVSKGYADDLAFNGAGVVDANTISKGVSELATAGEIANGTVSGGSGVLVIPASQASSSRGLNAGQGVVVVTDSNGTIDDDFLPRNIATSTTFSATTTFSGVTQFTGTTTGTGKFEIFTATTTSTWTKPTGAKFIRVIAIGGGGGGGGGRRGANQSGAGGGGAGGYSDVIFDAAVATTSTINVTVGAGGANGVGRTGTDGNGTDGAAGGNSSFGALVLSTGGTGGSGSGVTAGTGGVGSIYNGIAGGAGGAASGAGVAGATSVYYAPTGGGGGGGSTANGAAGGAKVAVTQVGGAAGTSLDGGTGVFLANTIGGTGGGGGKGIDGSVAGTGGDGGLYGAGGGGGGASTTSGGNGGKGAQGIVIVITY